MQRTLMVGLDGATFTLLDRLMADGVMPFLRDSASRGARGTLLSTPNPLTPPAWTSLVTGRTPGKHGIFDFVRAEEGPEGLFFTLNTSEDIRCETIWSMVSRSSGTVTCLNFPVSYPPFTVNGHIVPGFVSWKHLRRAVYPSGFYDFLKSVHGFDPKMLCMDMNEEFRSIQGLPQDQHEEWIQRHIDREKQWFGIVRAVLERYPTDLVGIIFDGVDKLQHLCWRLLDPELAPRAPTSWEARVRERCLEYFRHVDGFLRELTGLAGSDARIFITSDHGFGATEDVFYANVWLEQDGYLTWADAPKRDELGRISTETLKNHVVGIDWKKTVAYALSPSSNGIFIRVAEKPGQVGIRPEEYQTFRSKLAAKLAEIRHPQTGKPFIKQVMTREEAFPGDHAQRAPDLTLVLEDHGFISILNAAAYIRSRPEVVGTHHPSGVFLAWGPGIRPAFNIGPVPIVDVAPTLLYSLGAAIPDDLDGRVLTECFKPQFIEAHPAVSGEASAAVASARVSTVSGSTMAEGDEEVIERLKALGYIE